MLTETENAEYLDEIRRDVCSRCVERPPGGPPCEPLGKLCGVEMHLPQLIESIRQVHSRSVTPYLEHNRNDICSQCALLHSSVCPCPMDYLSVLIVEAVEKVDQRQRRYELCKTWRKDEEVPDFQTVRRVYEQAAGSWTGCDWPTHFGKSGLDLNGMDTKSVALLKADADPLEDWRAAADWLAEVERRAREAERKAGAAVKAVADGRWEEALHFIECAWALEFSTGRPLRHGFPLTWQRLREVIERGCIAHKAKSNQHA
jgi:hypothetical protein